MNARMNLVNAWTEFASNFLFYARGYTKTIITVTGDIITSPYARLTVSS